MNQNEIMAMAKEAGFEFEMQQALSGEHLLFTDGSMSIGRMQRLVALVAEKAAAEEREACAQVCDEMHEHYTGFKDTALLNGDVALSNAASGEPRACEFLSAAIRARGQKEGV